MGRRATLNSRKRNRRILIVSVTVIILGLIAGIYFIIQASYNGPFSSYIGQPVPSGVLGELTGISDSTLSGVGSPSGVVPLSNISGSSLTSGNKPEILYVGGEYCPYCAVERWSLIIALSRFGQFTGIEYMQSSSTDVNPDSPTFTFRDATFTSSYVSFVPVEEYDRSGAVRQSLTPDQQSLVSQYDVCPRGGSSGGVPFVDIANRYAVNCGVQSALDISGKNWTEIFSQLNVPTSNVAMLIDGSANTIITAICKVDGDRPTSVCSQPFATVAYSQTGSINYATETMTFQVRTRWTG